MNLADFVEKSLTEILEGIRAAQRKGGGGAVGAEMYGTPKGSLHHGGLSGLFTIVEFDVSVVAENKVGAKGALRVWGVGEVGGGAGLSNQQTSRVKFSVQLQIPRGDEAPKSSVKSRESGYAAPL